MQASPGSSQAPRIALVFQGDATDPRSWSGIPTGLSEGLRAVGATPIAIDARAPAEDRIVSALRLPWTARATNPVLPRLGGIRAKRAITRLGRFDGAIAIGSGYELPTPVPCATFDDMTVAQAIEQPESEYQALSARGVKRWQERQRHNYEVARVCCAASEWAAGSIRDDYGVDPSKVSVVGFGRSLEGRPIERDWSVPRFLFIGMDWERKQGGAVVDAFALIRDSFPAATLDLVGRHPPIEGPGVRTHGVLQLGSAAARKELEGLLEAATCLVLPSRFEPFGIAYVEAAAFGVPSIGTTRGGAADAVGDGGILIDPDDKNALLEAMQAMCDPKAAESWGDRAYRRSAWFSWEAVAGRILAALELNHVEPRSE